LHPAKFVAKDRKPVSPKDDEKPNHRHKKSREKVELSLENVEEEKEEDEAEEKEDEPEEKEQEDEEGDETQQMISVAQSEDDEPIEPKKQKVRVRQDDDDEEPKKKSKTEEEPKKKSKTEEEPKKKSKASHKMKKSKPNPVASEDDEKKLLSLNANISPVMISGIQKTVTQEGCFAVSGKGKKASPSKFILMYLPQLNKSVAGLWTGKACTWLRQTFSENPTAMIAMTEKTVVKATEFKDIRPLLNTHTNYSGLLVCQSNCEVLFHEQKFELATRQTAHFINLSENPVMLILDADDSQTKVEIAQCQAFPITFGLKIRVERQENDSMLIAIAANTRTTLAPKPEVTPFPTFPTLLHLCSTFA